MTEIHRVSAPSRVVLERVAVYLSTQLEKEFRKARTVLAESTNRVDRAFLLEDDLELQNEVMRIPGRADGNVVGSGVFLRTAVMAFEHFAQKGDGEGMRVSFERIEKTPSTGIHEPDWGKKILEYYRCCLFVSTFEPDAARASASNLVEAIDALVREFKITLRFWIRDWSIGVDGYSGNKMRSQLKELIPNAGL
jgi:hypothetical protein